MMASYVRGYDVELRGHRCRVLNPNDSLFASHSFWVFFAFVFEAFPELSFAKELQTNFFVSFGALKMGGKRKRVDPVSCREWMKKEEVWEILRRGNFTCFMERFNGGNLNIMQHFIKTWREISVMVGNQRMEITVEVIAEAMGLEMEGLNFYRERKLSDRAIAEFADSKVEKSRMIKVGKSYINPALISHP